MHAPMKTAFLIVIISLAIFSSLTFLPPNIYASPDWLEGWTYRKWHTIIGASGAGTDYQVKFNLHYSNIRDSGNHVYLNNNSRTDFGDIRFTDDDGTTLLDYWIESKTDSDTAIFWVEVADDLSSYDRVIQLYYDKSDATSISNGTNTFLLFSDNGMNGWIEEDANEWDTYDVGGSHGNVIRSTTAGDFFTYIYQDLPLTVNAFSINYDVFMHVGTLGDTYRSQFARIQNSGGTEYAYSEYYKQGAGVWREAMYGVSSNESVGQTLVSDWNSQTWYSLSFRVATGISGRFQFYEGTSQNWDSSFNNDIDFTRVRLGVRRTQAYYDNIRVRKWVYPSLVHGSWGSEQQEDSSWLEGWAYRKSHVIESATNAGANHQIKIIVHYGSDQFTDSGEDVYLHEHCQTDFDDVRFTKLDHTLLDHWLEVKVDNDYAIFWVKIAYDLSENRTIYIYYGNPSVSSASNGDTTFDNLFDDFESESLNTNKWNVSGTISLNSSLAYTGNKSLQVGTGTSKIIWRIENYPLPINQNCIHIMYHDKCNVVGDEPYETHFLFTNGGGVASIGVEEPLVGTADFYYLCRRSEGGVVLGVWRSTGWHRLEMRRTENIRFIADRYESGSQTTSFFNLTSISVGSTDSYNAVVSHFDNFYVRKYVYPEPSHIENGEGSGGEEGAPAIAGNIFVDGNHDTTGLNFTISNATFSQTLVDGQWGNIRTGNYTLNATSYFDDPETYHFSYWSSYPLGENQIENTTAPLTNVTISKSGHISLYLETEPHQIDTYIRVNDNPPTENLTFTINDVTYANGQYALLWGGDYSINATTIQGYSFINWASVGNVSVQNTTDPTTTITVTGAPSSITLYLSAPALNIVVRVDDQKLEYSYDAVILADKGYRDSDSIQLANGTYTLSANLAGGYGFLNWETSGATGEHYFGNKTIGSYNTTTPMNQKTAAYGTSYYLDRRANMTTIWLYCWASADVQKGRCGIYSIEGYDIENAVLMGSTQELTGINTTAMWRNFTFAGGLVLEAGSYALIIHAGDISAGLRGKYDAETGSHSQGNVPDTYADGLSNTFGSGGSNISNCYVSIYAEYTYDLLYVHNATEQTTFLTTYAYKVSDVTLTLNLYELPDLTNLYTWIALLLAALFLMIWSPSWVAWGIKKRGVTPETIERLGYGMLLFLVGFGLLVMWLYS